MLRMLEVSEGRFSLSIAVCNSPALRDYLIQRLRESRPGIEVIDLSDTDRVTDLMSHIRDNSPEAPSALMLIGMETSLSSAEINHPILQSLNASREQLEKRNHWPVLIWLPEYAAGILSLYAPDLWRYRSHRSGAYLKWQARALACRTVLPGISVSRPTFPRTRSGSG